MPSGSWWVPLSIHIAQNTNPLRNTTPSHHSLTIISPAPDARHKGHERAHLRHPGEPPLLPPPPLSPPPTGHRRANAGPAVVSAAFGGRRGGEGRGSRPTALLGPPSDARGRHRFPLRCVHFVGARFGVRGPDKFTGPRSTPHAKPPHQSITTQQAAPASSSTAPRGMCCCAASRSV